MNAAMQQIVLKGKDVNSALREASETIDKQIAEDKASDR
jgi:hypothetical protein